VVCVFVRTKSLGQAKEAAGSFVLGVRFRSNIVYVSMVAPHKAWDGHVTIAHDVIRPDGLLAQCMMKRAVPSPVSSPLA